MAWSAYDGDGGGERRRGLVKVGRPARRIWISFELIRPTRSQGASRAAGKVYKSGRRRFGRISPPALISSINLIKVD
jgi:hypothetical protein